MAAVAALPEIAGAATAAATTSGGTLIFNGLLIAASFGILPIIDALKPKTPPPELTTTVSIGVGSLGSEDGRTPDVHVADLQGLTIGTASSGDKLVKGQSHDIMVTQAPVHSDSVVNPSYVTITTGGDDAICISYAIVTGPNKIGFTWYGDTGVQCGADWFWGNTTVSIKPKEQGGGEYQPKCVWLDNGNAHNLTTRGFGFHLESFILNTDRTAQYQNNQDLLCKSKPRFHIYRDEDEQDVNKGVSYFKSPVFNDTTLLDFDEFIALDDSNWGVGTTGSIGLGRRGKHALRNSTAAKYAFDGKTAQGGNSTGQNRGSGKSSWHRGSLVQSSHMGHSAKELCESPGSWGPDAVSLSEGLFCDMETKQLSPLCTPNTQAQCFDHVRNEMRLAKGNGRRGARSGGKIYHTVHNWN